METTKEERATSLRANSVRGGLQARLIRDVDTLEEAAAKALDESRTFRRVWQQRAPTDAEQMALRTVLKVKVEDPLDAVLGWPNP